MALASLVLAFAVLSGIFHSEARYFYCDAVGLAATDPCVQDSPNRRGPEQALEESVPDCCEVVTLPAMPEGARADGPTVPPAARVAVIPAGGLAERRTAKDSLSSGPAPERGPPPHRGPREARERLMVFLT